MTSINSAHAFHSLPGESRNVFEKMLSRHLDTCLIDPLAQPGLPHEAYDILASMPTEARSNTFGSIFGACKIHGEAGLAGWAEKLFHLKHDKLVLTCKLLKSIEILKKDGEQL